MKNVKNLLLTGITLAIALFASVQVTAMEPSDHQLRMAQARERLNQSKQRVIAAKQNNIRAVKDNISQKERFFDPKNPIAKAFSSSNNPQAIEAYRRLREEIAGLNQEIANVEAQIRQLEEELQQ